MAEQTAIQWADATYNPWWGCERVSPACAHCYADRDSRRFARGAKLWDAGHTFRFFGDKHWDEPLRWARTLPAKLGRRPRVFCASMADVFEERPELEDPRVRLMMLIERTPELDWLLLTKRPEFARDWMGRWYDAIERGNFPAGTRAPRPYPNVWLGVSIENARFTWRADVLREIPAAVRFISAEPLLGSLFEEHRAPATYFIEGRRIEGARSNGRAPLDLADIDWVIIGGESGSKARPFRIEHAVEIIENIYSERAHQRVEAPGPPAIFVKQLGAKPIFRSGLGGYDVALELRDPKGGDCDEWPADLRIREFPTSAAVPA